MKPFAYDALGFTLGYDTRMCKTIRELLIFLYLHNRAGLTTTLKTSLQFGKEGGAKSLAMVDHKTVVSKREKNKE